MSSFNTSKNAVVVSSRCSFCRQIRRCRQLNCCYLITTISASLFRTVKCIVCDFGKESVLVLVVSMRPMYWAVFCSFVSIFCVFDAFSFLYMAVLIQVS